jgi:hypothetical protein
MTHDEFTRLFVYIEKRFDKLEKRVEDTADKEQVDHILSYLDSFFIRN